MTIHDTLDELADARDEKAMRSVLQRFFDSTWESGYDRGYDQGYTKGYANANENGA